MPWIIRLNWYDSLSTSPLVVTVDETRFGSWHRTQASTVLRAPPWKASASVFDPDVVPSAPWQALHLSLLTMVRRGSKVPVSASSLELCCTTVLTSTRGTTSGRGSAALMTSSLGSLIWPMLSTRAVPCSTAVALSSGIGMSIS